jgi:CpeT protein
MTIRLTLLAFMASITLAQAAEPPAASTPAAAPLDAAVSMLCGSFSSTEQASKDQDYFDIRLHMVRIWKDAPDGVWLYVEQAMAAAMQRPYRQRIYHVTEQADGTVRSEIFLLPGEAMKFAGRWKTPAAFDAIKPADLKKKDGCDVTLRRATPTSFDGETQGKGCASDRSGAAYTTSQVHLDPQGLVSWDRGFDADGNQVWGAEKGGYRFKRVSDEVSELPPVPEPAPVETPKEPPAKAEPRVIPTPTRPDLVHPTPDSPR